VDAEGARVLRHRIEQHQHWLEAAAVRDGRQPARDPDAADLVHYAGTVRRYEPSGGTPYEKRLVNGLWIAQTVSEVRGLVSAGGWLDDPSPSAA
jgi:hypothetical protein